MDNGGIAGSNIGNIENCKNKGKIDGGYETGGIVGAQYENGKISRCVNEGIFIETFATYQKGGILGLNSGNGIVEYCSNLSDIEFYWDSSHGGIVGDNKGNGIIQYCFNKGNLNQERYFIGGIAGSNVATIQYCYNTGNISTTKGNGVSSNAGVYGIGSSGNVKNCYNIGEIKCLQGGRPYQIAGPDATIQNSYYLGTNSDDETCKDLEFMKTQDFVDLLNADNGEIFCMDEDVINDGYPILSWQSEKSKK